MDQILLKKFSLIFMEVWESKIQMKRKKIIYKINKIIINSNI